MPAWLSSSATTSQPQVRRLPAMVARSRKLTPALNRARSDTETAPRSSTTPAIQGPTFSIWARPSAVAAV